MYFLLVIHLHYHISNDPLMCIIKIGIIFSTVFFCFRYFTYEARRSKRFYYYLLITIENVVKETVIKILFNYKQYIARLHLYAESIKTISNQFPVLLRTFYIFFVVVVVDNTIKPYVFLEKHYFQTHNTHTQRSPV